MNNLPEYDVAIQEDQEPAPPAYTSLPEAVAADMNSLGIGDPNEIISVPMVHSTEQKRKRDLFLPGGKKGLTTQTVIVRKMTRERYLQRYARDTEGNYVGTAAPAADAGLVFVLGKSSSEELLLQVERVAFGREHDQKSFLFGGVIAGGAGGAF